MLCREHSGGANARPSSKASKMWAGFAKGTNHWNSKVGQPFYLVGMVNLTFMSGEMTNAKKIANVPFPFLLRKFSTDRKQNVIPIFILVQHTVQRTTTSKRYTVVEQQPPTTMAANYPEQAPNAQPRPLQMGAKGAYIVRLLMVGDSSCGKTSLVLRYDQNVFSTKFVTTIGVDYRDKMVKVCVCLFACCVLYDVLW